MSSRSPRGDPTTLFDFVKEPHPDFDECLPPAKAEVRYCPQHWLPLLEFCVIRERGIRPDRIFGKDRPSQIKFLGLAAGKEVRRFGDREYILEQAIKGDLALVRADIADRYGNLAFRYAQMNFGPVMATAAARVVVEVRAVLEEPIPYERVQLPGLYVDRVVTVGA